MKYLPAFGISLVLVESPKGELKMPQKHLLLIDGSSLLSCSFFGNLPKEYKFARTDEEKDKYLDKIRKSPQGYMQLINWFKDYITE